MQLPIYVEWNGAGRWGEVQKELFFGILAISTTT